MTSSAVFVTVVAFLGLLDLSFAVPNFCTVNGNGDYPYPPNCNNYITCSNGILSVRPCPANTQWNDSEGICDHPQNSDCNPCGGGLPTDNYPDPTDCTKFISCVHGYTYWRDCPANLHFDSRLKVCNYDYDAGCSLTT